MAHIFKHPNQTNKGIIVFTHKEMQWFYPDISSLKSLKSFMKNPLKKFKSVKQKSIKNNQEIFHKIQNSYFIGVNIGADPNSIPPFENCDFYFAPEEVIVPNNVMKIPLNSRNFISKVFSPRDDVKYWDIVCVSRSPKAKNLDLFLQSIRKIFDNDYHFKVLLVSPQNYIPREHYFYNELMDDYYELFTYEERQNFQILRISNETSFPGLSPEIISHFYNSSKVFTLFSQAEGVSKAISEALCCGLPVVVKNDLRGGGQDFLNETNSLFFNSYESAHETLIEAVKNYEKFTFDPIEIRKHLGEEYSIDTLKTYFTKLYEINNRQFDGELINTDRLSNRLGAHINDVIPWAKNRFTPSDITTDVQLQTFIKNLQLN